MFFILFFFLFRYFVVVVCLFVLYLSVLAESVRVRGIFSKTAIGEKLREAMLRNVSKHKEEKTRIHL